MTYDAAEQHEIHAIFSKMLRKPTEDGGRKRLAGEKPSWKVDPAHEAALFSHLSKWKAGLRTDDASGAHPLVHLAWRALAIAWQEEAVPEEPSVMENEEEYSGLTGRDCPLCEAGAMHQLLPAQPKHAIKQDIYTEFEAEHGFVSDGL